MTPQNNLTKRVNLALTVLIALSVGCPLSSAHAQNVDATDRGWYSAATHFSNNDNYLVGGGVNEVHNWFLFAIPAPAVGQAYTGATLRLFNPMPVPPGFLGGYQSPDPTETYSVTNFTGSFSDLVADNGNGNNASIYNDLGTGADYGSVVVSSADNGTFVTVTLSAAALADINAAAGQPLTSGGNFALGGFISTTDGESRTIEQVFGISGGGNLSDTQLVLTQSVVGAAAAPEPGTFALTLWVPALGVGGFFASRRRR